AGRRARQGRHDRDARHGHQERRVLMSAGEHESGEHAGADAHAGPDAGEDADEQAGAIPREEERLLERVHASLAAQAEARAPARPGATPAAAAASARYDEELVALRDEMAEARLEDVAALVAQMERLQGVSLRRAEAQAILVDPASPYFGHLRLREEVPGRAPVERDVFIGRATYVDAPG